MERLIHLHKKYFPNSKEKAIEDLQRDFSSVNGDFRKLEVYLQGGKVAYWTDMEDFILTQYEQKQESTEYQMLLKVKGPVEVMNRKFFLKLC